eukprot:CAMPEP_0177644462 /NCGR_PEP_ID=MMETSP0447-20121125/8703_1 /TAXON_ID=0 /ORGANISM="Stygamoeba regulata, Strain BSH-02190019" /LENGTH=476 /DNA_ID=CAMNT_0019146829 /DNA_START=24 /DNA_END=1454 /DNA_ORIENTATION=-
MTLVNSMKGTREVSRRFLNAILGVSLVIGCLLVSIYLLLYLGSSWNPIDYVDNVDVGVIVLDSGFDFEEMEKRFPQSMAILKAGNVTTLPSIGGLFKEVIKDEPRVRGVFNWDFPNTNSRDKLREMVNDGDYWLGVVIPPPLSMSLLAAHPVVNLTDLVDAARRHVNYTQSTDEYKIELIYDQGRHSTAISIILAVMDALIQSINAGFANEFLNHEAYTPLLAQMVPPYAVAQPLQTIRTNLHPVSDSGENTASYIFSVVMWIGSLVAMASLLRATVGDVSDQLAHHDFVPPGLVAVYRIVLMEVFLLTQSILINLIYLGFGGDIESGHWGTLFFFTFYFSNAFMAIIGLLAVLLGPLFQLPATILLVVQLTCCEAIMPHVLQPAFFKLGVALPMRYAVRGTRHILFGSYNRIMEDCLVLMAWIVGPLLVGIPLGIWKLQKRWETVLNSAAGDVMANAASLPAESATPATITIGGG